MTSEADAAAPPAERRHRQRAQLRVVVADDDHDSADSLALLLREVGHVVHAVYAGSEVLQLVRTFRPDAIILDLNLPKLSGYALAQATRHDFLDMRRPLLIAISGVWTQGPDQIVGRQVGFDHYLIKPADPKELLDLLDAIRKPKP